MEMISNVVNNDSLSDLYVQIMEDLGNCLERSYGPYGSNSLIQKGDNALPVYTKDGHTILANIKYHNIIERTIVSNIQSITEYIVKGSDGVGDGTTSAVLLARNMLKNLIELMKKYKKEGKHVAPVQIVRTFQKIVNKMIDTIKNNGRDFEIKDALDISLISTNGDEKISKQIYQLYKELGKEVYIALNTTTQKDDIVGIYNGLVLETGLIEEAYVNNPDKNNCTIKNPHIYAFTDPVDTPEMIAFFDTIVNNNIWEPIMYMNGQRKPKIDKNGAPVMIKGPNGNMIPDTEEYTHTEIIPTVIITPKMSRDASSLMERITDTMGKFNGSAIRQRPPILVLTNLGDVDNDMYSDIMQLCGCRPIKKYIDPRIQLQDQKAGNAPTYETVDQFYGTASSVMSDHYKTTFIEPTKMYNVVAKTDGIVELEPSETYKSLLAYLETELKKAYADKATYQDIYHIRKRINSLKASYVEWFVGGVSASDRDQRKSAIEDAVMNCRSAARDGVGFGANVEAYRAICGMSESENPIENDIVQCIRKAYADVIRVLYREYCSNIDMDLDLVLDIILTGEVPNAAGEDYPVLSSIMSDVRILEGISNLITIMATSNQYICPEPANTFPYRADYDIKKRKEQELAEKEGIRL